MLNNTGIDVIAHIKATSLTSLTTNLTGMGSNSLEKTSGMAMPHSMQVARASSSVKCAQEVYGNRLCDPPAASGYQPLEVCPYEVSHILKVQYRKAIFPTLKGDETKHKETTSSKPELTVSGKRNPWARSLRRASEGDDCLFLGSKSVLPEIKTKSKDRRSLSLPISTENVADLGSFLYEEHTDTTTDLLPMITEPENDAVLKKILEGYPSSDCLASNMAERCPGVSEIPPERDRFHAVRKRVKEEETDYNETEMRASRLFEWLKNQADRSDLS